MSTRGTEGGGVHRWLAPVSLAVVALAALMGWGASFVGLHDYAQHAMSGYTALTAWLLPATYDGAAFACTLMTYRASIYGRSAVRGRVLMWGFTAVSAWINWIHQPVIETKLVAAGLPVAAVAVFDVVLLELRADYEARHGRRAFRLRPGLLVLRWCVDRAGTASAFRDQITRIPVDQIAGLAGHATGAPIPPLPADRPASTVTPPKIPAETQPAATPRPVQNPPNATSNGSSNGSAAGMSVKLPQTLIDRLQQAHAQAVSDGRQFTTADVQQVVKVNTSIAGRIVAELVAANGTAR